MTPFYIAGPPVKTKLNSSTLHQELAHSLFGSDSNERMTGKAIWLFILFAVFLAALLFLRRPDALLHPQFWAEDGNLFFAEQFYGQASLFKPYAGYLTLIPRLAAMFADRFPVLWAPLIYNAFALALASISIAWFALPAFRHLLRSDKLRVLACLLIALMPSIGPLLANLNNLQYYLTIQACLICLQPFPRPVTKYLLLGLYLILLLTTPTAVILAPLWLLRAWLVPQDRKASLVIAALQAGYALVIKFWLLAPATTYHSFHLTHLLGVTLKLIVARVGMMSLLGPKFIQTSLPHTLAPLILFGMAGLIFCGILIWRARSELRFLIQTALIGYLVFASVAVLILVRTWNPPADLYYTVGGARYFFFGAALFYIWLLSALDRLWSSPWIRAGIIVIIVGMGFTAKQNFSNLQTFADLQWPRWAEGFEQARKSQARFPADVPINPRPWVIPGSGRLPPDTLSLVQPLEPRQIEQMQKTGTGRQSLGKNSALLFTLDRPRYVFALRIRYLLQSSGSPSSPAQLSWRLDPAGSFFHDAALQSLPLTGDQRVTKLVWILDELREFQIQAGGAGNVFQPAEIIVLSSPHPLASSAESR